MPASRPLRERFEEKFTIGEPDECWEWKASLDRHGYGQINRGREDGKSKVVRAHRISYELYVGPIPDGLFLDHKCENRSCVNPNHLRPATNAQNLAHRGKASNNTSGYKGVTYHKAAKKWMAQIKPVYLGLFNTPEEAYAAYCSAVVKYHGDFAHL